MKTRITIEVEHRRELPHLAAMIAGRAWTIDGVVKAEVVEHHAAAPAQPACALERAGFTEAEIALGRTEVVRGS